MSVNQELRVDTGSEYYLDQDPRNPPAMHLVNFVDGKAKGKRILDFGCGIGAYSYELKRRGYDPVGIDANPKYIEIAKSNGITAQVVNAKALPFPDKSFDTTILLEVLEHLPDDIIDYALTEIRRVTKQNVLITVPDNTQYEELLRHGFLYGHYHAIDHVQFFTDSNIRAFLGKYFSKLDVVRGDPLFPHRLLPPMGRKMISALYRLGLMRPTIYSRLFVDAAIEAS